MDDFIKKFSLGGKKDDKKKASSTNNNNTTPPKHNNPLQQFQNIFQPKQQNDKSSKRNNNSSYYRGGGVALGTSNKPPPGSKIVEIELKQNNSITEVGIFVEKTASNSAIISAVTPDSAGNEAGFIRGDVICFPGSQGMEEMHYDQFLIMLKERSTHSLHFEVRRVVASSNTDTSMSADAYVKRQAVIAAAEQRNKKNKSKTTMAKQYASKDYKAKPTNNMTLTEASTTPMSEQSKNAVEAAKLSEARDVQNLGYNPYKTTAVSAGQAKKTVVDVIHGEINTNAEAHRTTVTPPPPLNTAAAATNNNVSPPAQPLSIHESFDTTFSTFLSSNSNNSNTNTSLSILTKLITNALTKPDDKFRRVRLSNPKIQSNIVQIQDAMDIMMVFGFVLLEEDDEMWLVYSCDAVEEDEDTWKIQALEYMKQCL